MLIEMAVRMGATNPPGKSQLHGEGHWKTVAIVGFWLARHSPVPISLPFLYTFAQLHDIMRLNDSNPGDPDDSGHGARAADLFSRMVANPGIEEFPPYAVRTEDMHYALAYHVTAARHDGPNPHIGLCWDADRLTLYRVGIAPDDRLLTTEAARTREAKAVGLVAVNQMVTDRLPSWRDLRREFDQWRLP